MKIREIIRILEDDGWILARTKGNHRQYRHPMKKGLVTIAGHHNDDLARGTLSPKLPAIFDAEFRDALSISGLSCVYQGIPLLTKILFLPERY